VQVFILKGKEAIVLDIFYLFIFNRTSKKDHDLRFFSILPKLRIRLILLLSPKHGEDQGYRLGFLIVGGPGHCGLGLGFSIKFT
jgi:hypothetical protein